MSNLEIGMVGNRGDKMECVVIVSARRSIRDAAARKKECLVLMWRVERPGCLANPSEWIATKHGI